MNLIYDPFIPVLRKSGKKEKIAPWQITEIEDPIIALNAPRPDFNGALMQFLIGLLQTSIMPTEDQWWEWLEKEIPIPDKLKQHLKKYAFAFETAGTPAFMQDFDNLENLKSKKKGENDPKPIEWLLIDAPGENTIKENKDHFIKQKQVQKLCPECTVIALFTLQTNAPLGGQGHRTSLRGGGPLTTLVVLDDKKWEQEPRHLWVNCWLNVLSKQGFEEAYAGSAINNEPKDIFPWLANTRSSEKTIGKTTTPEDVHLLQMYWGMPRRIRIQWPSKKSPDSCDLCNEQSSYLITHYKTKPHGINYKEWRHHLTPYYEKKDKEKGSIKVAQHLQEDGISYHHWINYLEENSATFPATVVKRYHQLVDRWESEQFRLHSFGYDMDKMKARCWYETTFPFLNMDKSIRVDFSKNIQNMTSASELIAGYFSQAVYEAWFQKKKSLPFLKKLFYQKTEKRFFRLIKSSQDNINSKKHFEKNNILVEDEEWGDEQSILQKWHKVLKQEALDLFDYWTKQGDFSYANPKRIIQARKNLERNLHSKTIKDILRLPNKPKTK